jgi:hypothetical protein
MSNSVNILVFLSENSDKNLFKEYVFKLDKKIIDVKNSILEDLKSKSNTMNLSKDNYNYIDLDNITEKIYKDFGKLFFSNGVLPIIFDNYKLSEFTIENRTFQFLAIPKLNNVNNKQFSKPSGVLKKVIHEQNNKKNEFVFDNNDFPPLGK